VNQEGDPSKTGDGSSGDWEPFDFYASDLFLLLPIASSGFILNLAGPLSPNERCQAAPTAFAKLAIAQCVGKFFQIGDRVDRKVFKLRI
jgi:hypothetical protein